MEKIEVLIIKPNNVYTKVLNDDYRDFKKEINISSPITCISRKIGEKYFDIWLDDEGLFKQEEDGTIKSIAVCTNAEEILAGNLMIANNDGQGNVLSLSDDDVKMIRDNLGVPIMDFKVKYNTSIGPCTMKFDRGNYILNYKV